MWKGTTIIITDAASSNRDSMDTLLVQEKEIHDEFEVNAELQEHLRYSFVDGDDAVVGNCLEPRPVGIAKGREDDSIEMVVKDSMTTLANR
jgi:hypothetical protein